MSDVKEKKKIPLGRPVFDEREKEAVSKVFDTPWVLDGPQVREFEKVFKEYVGSEYAAAVTNCTTGMHIALCAFGFEANSEVLLPALNFTADGLSVLQAGLKPVFVEINPKTGNMDVEDLRKKITPKSRAILALHYGGRPAKMDEILEIAKQSNLKIVEDAAHALGAAYGDKKIGAVGDATVFSFGPLKMICTGMGGMVTSNDEVYNQKIITLRSYGMNKSMWNRKEDRKPWNYSIHDLGHNFRMTDFSAAIGIVQIDKLDGFIANRKELAAKYDSAFAEMSEIECFEDEPNSTSVPLYYTIKVKQEEGESRRDDLLLFLMEKGVGASVHWDPPLHKHPLYQAMTGGESSLPQTEKVTSQMLSLPLAPDMPAEEVDYIISCIREFFSKGAN